MSPVPELRCLLYFAGIRVPLTKAELHILQKEFRGFFKIRKVPDGTSVSRAINHYPVLQKRTCAQIKSRAWALIQKQVI